jgi:3',5'-cyclic AMP phosphodiesterase CpdA
MMKTIAHISDLHFGTEDSSIVAALKTELCTQPPSLLIVSGDLTQRARTKQFEAARAFLNSLPGPQLVVPGNHDVPLFDVARRFFAPLTRYRRTISKNLDPVYRNGELLAVGLNTARSLTWQNGRISLEQIEHLRHTLASEVAKLRVVVTHHPFIPPPGPDPAGIDLVGRAARALVVLDEQRVDLLLAGHLHEGYSGITQPYYPTARRAIVAAQAGTAVSRRTRKQANGYNVIHWLDETLEVEIRTWNGHGFVRATVVHYERKQGTWARVGAT